MTTLAAIDATACLQLIKLTSQQSLRTLLLTKVTKNGARCGSERDFRSLIKDLSVPLKVKLQINFGPTALLEVNLSLGIIFVTLTCFLILR